MSGAAAKRSDLLPVQKEKMLIKLERLNSTTVQGGTE